MEDLRSISPPAKLKFILERTTELGFNMASEPLTGAFLRTLAASKPRGRLLELGTGTGIATAWLLDGMDAGSRLVSVDNDASVQVIACEAFGQDTRLTLVTGDGIEFLKSVDAAAFDLVFADAMPGKYDGLEHALNVVKPGGFYVIDDMLPQANWPEGHAAKVPPLVETLASNQDFVAVPMNWASGLVVLAKRS